MDELAEVELEPGKKMTIGRDIDVSLMTALISCMFRNIDVFAWSVEDMPKIDPSVAIYKLNSNMVLSQSSKGRDSLH